MTIIKYIMSQGVCTVSELSTLQRTDKEGAQRLKEMAREEMNFLGVEVTEA